jgi:hypothetical protein
MMVFYWKAYHDYRVLSLLFFGQCVRKPAGRRLWTGECMGHPPTLSSQWLGVTLKLPAVSRMPQPRLQLSGPPSRHQSWS